MENKGYLKSNKIPVSHRFKSIMSYPHLSRHRINLERILFRFNVLRKYAPKKAVISLLFDIVYKPLTAVRNYIPMSLKTMALDFFDNHLASD